uniref:Large ribosomal subunit protein uL4m n=1 Tax=Oryza nivara TaxID=4536 RepID=A0A0E0GI55_ORYNI
MCGSAVRYVIGRVGVPPNPNPSSPRFLFRPPPPPSPTTSGRLFRSPRSSPPMRALPRGAAASLLRAAAAAAPCRPRPVQLQRRLPDADRLLAMNIPAVCFSRYSTLVTPSDEVLVPPELLSSRTVGTPERKIGQYEDLNNKFHNEDKGYMVLDGDVFDVPIRKDIVHRVVRWQLAKRQQGTHSTKIISEVSGTGRKPYKQKGTGRARHGTLRGPQFRGGATMHGPKPRSHAIKLQKKVRRLGLKIALSARTAEGKLLVFEDLEVPSHKTKNVVSYISQMEDTKKVLLVDGGDIDKKLKLATQNLHYVNVLPSIGLNVYSILQHDTLWLKVGGGWVAARARDGAAVGGSGKMFCRYQHVRCSRAAGVYTS